jgi:hypothetical protein
MYQAIPSDVWILKNLLSVIFTLVKTFLCVYGVGRDGTQDLTHTRQTL